MGALLGDTTLRQHNDVIAVIDRSQTMCHEDAGSRLLFEYAVNVLQQLLFCVSV